MSDTANQLDTEQLIPDPRVDVAGVVVDVSCMGCDYNLRGAASDASCPECGKAVIDSLKYDDLTLSDPAWLKRVASGTQRLAVAMIGLPVVVVVYFLLAGGIVTTVIEMTWPLLAVTAAVGCWGVASAEPGVLLAKGHRSILALRWLGMLMGLMAMGIIVAMALALMMPMTGPIMMGALLFALGIVLIQPAAIVLVELRLKGLLHRANREHLLTETRWVLRGLAATLVIWLVGMVLLAIVARLSGRTAFGGGGPAKLVDNAYAIIAIGQFVLALVLIMSFIRSAVLLRLHAKLFREVRKLAIERAGRVASSTAHIDAVAHGQDTT